MHSRVQSNWAINCIAEQNIACNMAFDRVKSTTFNQLYNKQNQCYQNYTHTFELLIRSDEYWTKKSAFVELRSVDKFDGFLYIWNVPAATHTMEISLQGNSSRKWPTMEGTKKTHRRPYQCDSKNSCFWYTAAMIAVDILRAIVHRSRQPHINKSLDGSTYYRIAIIHGSLSPCRLLCPPLCCSAFISFSLACDTNRLGSSYIYAV